MPKFWVWFCRDWLGLDQQLSFSWWRALGKSPWSACAELRTGILDFDAHAHPAHHVGSDHLIDLIAPGPLMQTVDDLVRQRLLLKRDAGVITEAILARLDRDGAWR